MKAALEKAFPGIDVETIESSGGAFEVRRDDELVYSKLETGEFPADTMIVEKLRG